MAGITIGFGFAVIHHTTFLLADTLMAYTNSTTGKYDIDFSTDLQRGAWIPTAAMDAFYMQSYWVGVVFTAVDGCQIWVKDSSGSFADIPAGAFVSFVAHGGHV